MNKSPKVLGTFTLAMITMAAIVSLRNLSLTAELGFSAIFFLALAGIVFFIPTALVIAELAASWPRAGGCYVWVEEAYGKPLAFIAIWLSWMASVAWFPAVLAFTATMLAHMLTPVFPGLEHNTNFILLTMLAVFWGATLSNFIGIKFSGIFSSVGVMLGTLIPGALIILLGLWWIISGKPSQIPLNLASLIPDFKLDNLSLFAGVILGFAGVELAAYHISDAKDPQHSYPRALIIAVSLILVVYVLGTLAIAVVVPQVDLSLASGLIQAFTVFFANVGLTWLVPVIALFLFAGAMAGINAWIVGPAKGLLIVAQDGFLPRWLQQENSNGVPTALLLSQALVGSILALVFLYIQNSSASIWFLTALSAQFTCVQYILVFAAAVKLRYTQPRTPRAFKAPFIWLTAGLGIISCMFSFLIVYVPHGKLVLINPSAYCGLLVISFIGMLLPAWLLIKYRSRSNTAKFYSNTP